jgi:hypothetical protein
MIRLSEDKSKLRNNHRPTETSLSGAGSCPIIGLDVRGTDVRTVPPLVGTVLTLL